MTATTTAVLVPIQPAFTDAERLALAAFLAGYRGLTREAYALDLRQFTTWCRARSLNLFAVRRADIESFARDLEACGRARATVAAEEAMCRPPRSQTLASSINWARPVTTTKFHGCQLPADGDRRPASQMRSRSSWAIGWSVYWRTLRRARMASHVSMS